MNKEILIMIRKYLIYLIPVVLVIAGFALLPKSDQVETLEPISEVPDFVLEIELNDSIKVLKPERKNVQETRLVTELLKLYHYRKMPLDDSVSQVIYNNYLEAWDHSKLYFLKSDIESFNKYQLFMDDYLVQGNLDAAYQIFAVFQERAYERLATTKALLAADEFDFTLAEDFVYKRDSLDWLETKEELDDAWRKYLKYQLLSLKLSGKSREDAIEVLQKRYERYQTVIEQYKSADVYQVYMNAFTEAYDPHTSYFNPITAENFDIDMSKSLEGIGAMLSKDGDYTTVVSVVPGGPAFKSEQIHDNDKIIGVGQGDDGEIIDVVGWRNDDVVQLIRGKKGTVVLLSILKASDGINATPKTIRLVRDEINIEDTRAESKVYEFLHNDDIFKLGVITIPSFYKDFKNARDGKDFNSVTKDVRRLITDLKTQDIDGLMIDLRRNGGGALDEAIELTGLFIENGPVVQVKNYEGKTSQENDLSFETIYDGPLAVLTSRVSASASEIFAAAIQDYKRGLVVGEQSFGKGTVQNMLDLQRWIPKEQEKLGQLKLTIAKFYRVNGGSTQSKGVYPDLKLPSVYDEVSVGESAYPNSLPYDEIPSSNYKSADYVTEDLIAALQEKYALRIENDKDLQDLIAEAEQLRNEQKKTSISLNEEIRRAQMAEEEKNRPPQPEVEGEMESLETGAPEPKALKIKDIYLQESLFVLADLVSFKES
jgi:carboxyl-terminal processing protease